MQAKERIIVALDVDNLDQAKHLIRDLAPLVGCFKIGLEMITSVGTPEIINFVHSLGGKIFYDGKFDDIPNTVGKASKAVSKFNVKMFNVHASAGKDAMKAAAENKLQSKLIAVTVLTSIDEEDANSIFGASTNEKVLQFALDAKESGCDGIVCSPIELEMLKKHSEFNDFLFVTPGIRPIWAATGDQKRFTTPKQAILSGSSYLVIGRPITNPPVEIGKPIDAVIKITKEIQEALAEL